MFVIKVSKWYHSWSWTVAFRDQSLFVNYLICIFININENIKHLREIADIFDMLKAISPTVVPLLCNLPKLSWGRHGPKNSWKYRGPTEPFTIIHIIEHMGLSFTIGLLKTIAHTHILVYLILETYNCLFFCIIL